MRKYLIFFLLAIISSISVFSVELASIPFINNVDLKMKDLRFLLRGQIKPPDSVVVVAIDNKSVKEIGRWPWSREYIGRLISGMAEYGVKVTALDVVFSEKQNPVSDSSLADSIALSGNVIAGYFFRNEVQPVDYESLEQIQTSKIQKLQIDSGVTSVPLIEYENLDANIASITQSALGFGFFNVISDSDGLFRRAPLLMLYDGDIYPSIVLQALERYTENSAAITIGKTGVRSIELGKYIIPASHEGTLPVNYYGPTASIKTYSAVDIIKRRLPVNELKDKLAFVGFTEIGIYDVRPTPFDPILPGVEIHASIAANTLEQNFIIHNNKTILAERILLFSLPILLALLLAFAPSASFGFLTAGAFSLLYLVCNYFILTIYKLDLSIFSPLMALGLSTVSSEIYRSLVVDRKGRYMKKAFSNYVSADLVAQIMKNPESLKLGGEKREISILFSDIRGFTSISEKLSPEELVCLLNEYLNPMTLIVLEEKGTLDKYIGDAVMAIFNAPLDVDGHADHACRAALKMMAKLAELNKSFLERGMHTIDIGIGINTGDAVVGNMGAAMRFDYTAIGDNVNLASRLEGLNKMYGTHIIVSEATRLLAGDDMLFREIDLVAVKGKQLPIPIYELMILHDAELMSHFSHALNLYRESKFEAALKIFDDLSVTKQDYISGLYIQRCIDFIATPPPENWDGVFVAKTK
ncbi:MAG: adenylate/guanylate cyclase domain-containing protein [Desulfuromonadaceae bacterium]|nr:adenylate/guanylate cyclase domain-containing protein [Desulfuromonadaceae bacterium]MDD2856523.1 adenylate/guanylate cyclase domain-containing protein [Desulfuromonadaceae bacterium]